MGESAASRSLFANREQDDARTSSLAAHERIPLNHARCGLAERRRSRTYQPWGYHGLPVLTVGRVWLNGAVAGVPAPPVAPPPAGRPAGRGGG